MDPDEPEPSRPDCELDETGRIWIGPGSAARLHDCNIPEGAILSFGYQAERPHPKRAHKRKDHHKMEPAKTVQPIAAPDASTSIPTETVALPASEKDSMVSKVTDDVVIVSAVAPDTHEAVVEHPAAPAPFDPMAVAQQNPLLAFALAALAVVGGGAGFKLWTKMSEQKHETKMKELELEAQKAGLNGAQPPPCQVKQTEVDAKIAAVEARLGKAEKISGALPADFDAEELEKRVAKLEAAMKRMGVKPPAGGGK